MRYSRLGLALILTLTSAPARASEPPPDDLGRAFGNLRAFARRAEEPVAAAPPAAPADRPPPVAVGRVDLRHGVRWDGTLKEIVGPHERAFLNEIAELTQGIDGDRYDVDVSIRHEIYPAVTAHLHEGRASGRPWVQLWINSGAIAFAENRDEFAALVAQALSRRAPAVLIHRDDPRVMRRIEEQVAFDALPATARHSVLADVATIERLRAAGLRPWALTDLEKRVVTRYRKQWEERFHRHEQLREAGAPSDAVFTADELFEVRVLAQKIAVGYLQERENIRDLIRASHAFGPEWRDIRANAFDIYRDQLHPHQALARYIGVPLAVLSGVGALFYYVPVWDWILTQADLALHSDPARFAGLAALGALRAQVIAWTAELAWVQRAAGAAIDGLIRATEAFGDVLSAVFGPLWTELVGVLTPLAEAAWAALVRGWEVGLWLLNSVWLYLVVPAAGLAILYWVARSAVDAFIERRRTEGAIFHRWTLGQLNRWRRVNFVEEKLDDPRVGATDLERVRNVARDLHLTWIGAASLPFVEAIRYTAQDLRVIGDGYQAPEDFWTMLKDFLAQVTLRVRHGRIGARDLDDVLHELAPRAPFESLRKQTVTGARYEDFQHVLRRAIDRDDVRPVIGRLYEAARATYDVRPRPLDDFAGRFERTWADFGELTEVRSAWLGLARVAAEVEAVDSRTSPAALYVLNDALAERLRLVRVVNRLNKSYLPALRARVRDRGFRPDEARGLIQMFNVDKHLTRDDGRGGGPETVGDGWPRLESALELVSAGAFLRGRLDESAAFATLAGEVENHFPTLTQPTSYWPALAGDTAFMFTNAIRHVTEFAFNRKLARFGRLTDLAEYVERELLARGAVVERLTPLLFLQVTRRPELIRDEADVRALIDHEFFWPERPIARDNALLEVPRELRAIAMKHRAIDGSLHDALHEQKTKNPRAWRFETSLAQRLHHLIVTRLRELDLMPQDLAGLEALWRRLTDRGVTAETDRLMQDIIALADADEVSRLRDFATREGRVWEAELHSRMSLAQARASQPYRRLIESKPGDRARTLLIDEVVGDLKRSMPERGLAFARFLEDLSVQINSSYDEAKTLSEAKGDVATRSGSDDNLRAVRGVFREIAAWPRDDQFNFVKFLRGEARPSSRLEAAFPRVGLERIQRMYEILPLAARVGLFDTFFTHGLVRGGPEAKRWTERLARHIVGGDRTEAQRVTLQVLTAFLFAIARVGNAQMTTTILSYLYALPSSAVASPVEVLKLVLEIFGATGIKVGQFTYASQILGPAGETLRSLQSRARVPDRIEIYEDVYDMLGVPVGTPLPFLVLELLGAASMKYAFMGQDRETLARLVIKVFRLDAMNNVDLQFDVLEHMGEYLIRHHGPRYGVFKVIIQSARLAVRREGSMKNEIRRSRIARHRLYQHRSTAEVAVEVPREDLVNARMIIAQYAEGVCFDDLPAEAKPLFARTLLAMENDIYFADRDVIRFDPDRHAGNAQMLFRVNEGGDVTVGPRHALGPIDFGQLLRMTRAQRTRITKLFALAQIAGKVSVNDWVTNEIAGLLELPAERRPGLREALRAFVRAAGPRPVTLYVSVLAALEAGGFTLRDTTYIDFVRGLITLTPFERFAPDAPAPSRTFEAAVLAEVKAYARRHEFEPRERRAIELINHGRRWRAAILGGQPMLLPTDLARVNFDELIHREQEVQCPRALGVAN